MATPRPLRIATRASDLAVWQARHVASLLTAADADLRVELVPTSTEGDRRTDLPLSEIGGKGVFVKEVQAAVLDGRADVAVHSAKDLPAVTHPDLRIGAVPSRGDARDALVGSPLAELAPGATVATGSARRRVQLAALRPDLRFEELRGNMATRLEKAAGFDAIVVAAVALERLGLQGRVAEVLDPDLLVPQVGQGALAVECLDGDAEVLGALAAIDDDPSRAALECERAFLAELGGDCSLPAGAHAVAAGDGGGMQVTGILAASTATDGAAPARARLVGPGPAVGAELARVLTDAVAAGGPPDARQ